MATLEDMDITGDLMDEAVAVVAPLGCFCQGLMQLLGGSNTIRSLKSAVTQNNTCCLRVFYLSPNWHSRFG